MEALLRQRLSVAQLDDLDKTGTFCVKGNNRRWYRICVTNGPKNWAPWGPMRFVIDPEGYLRNFWFFHAGQVISDHHASALAMLMLLQANARGFEDYACREDVVMREWFPSHYGLEATTT